MLEKATRWSDEKLEEFHAEFLRHMVVEEQERIQQQAMYDALFQKEEQQILGRKNAIKE
ncbi:hypothetical protein [Candidatus Accumulibacter vicinus]|uniref:Uncharacterized protein n=1 Tax=Candidatus Accumulibacter vicinus TaxID=2954382 RepID=A0A084XUB4_9PROT|nr:hypothetical protein [Candidatus Accumulibacter vicinus]KFB66058.1 MAG: hypothetical protein CAPSK01_004661 [Candidatus Accumulibacter vicinus]